MATSWLPRGNKRNVPVRVVQGHKKAHGDGTATTLQQCTESSLARGPRAALVLLPPHDSVLSAGTALTKAGGRRASMTKGRIRGTGDRGPGDPEAASAGAFGGGSGAPWKVI